MYFLKYNAYWVFESVYRFKKHTTYVTPFFDRILGIIQFHHLQIIRYYLVPSNPVTRLGSDCIESPFDKNYDCNFDVLTCAIFQVQKFLVVRNQILILLNFTLNQFQMIAKPKFSQL